MQIEVTFEDCVVAERVAAVQRLGDPHSEVILSFSDLDEDGDQWRRRRLTADDEQAIE